MGQVTISFSTGAFMQAWVKFTLGSSWQRIGRKDLPTDDDSKRCLRMPVYRDEKQRQRDAEQFLEPPWVHTKLPLLPTPPPEPDAVLR